MKIDKIAILCTLLFACYAYTCLGAADFTQSFLQRGFGPTGDILRMENIWTAAGILSSRFDTVVQNNNYIQGNFLYFKKGTSSAANSEISGSSIKFNSPTSLRGVFGFQFETFARGFLWDSSVDAGSGTIEFSMHDYKYDVKFSEDANKKFNATIQNFVCNFDVQLNPVYDGTPREISRQLFPLLTVPINRTLTTFFCPLLKTRLDASLKTLMTEAQAQQVLNWSYGGFTARKTLSLSPTNTDPFKEGNFVITSNGTLSQKHEVTDDKMHLERSLIQVSDDSLKVQQDDLCFTFTDELINELIGVNVNFFKKYNIILNDKSGHQRFYPFNMWQFWEATLYDQELYKKIGTTAGFFKQVDPISMNCNLTSAAQRSTITPEGNIQLTVSYVCDLNIKDSLDGNKLKSLYHFTFDQLLTASFYLTESTLNAKVDSGEVKNVSHEFLDDLRQRFQMPLNLEIIANAKLLGQNGIKFTYIKNKKIRSARVGENLEICMF